MHDSKLFDGAVSQGIAPSAKELLILKADSNVDDASIVWYGFHKGAAASSETDKAGQCRKKKEVQ